MLATFASLADEGRINPDQFEPSVDSIKSAFDSAYSWFSPWIPFNPNCCTIRDIGNRADALTNQMLAAAGSRPLTEPPKPTGGGLTDLLFGNSLVWIGLGAVALYWLSNQPRAAK